MGNDDVRTVMTTVAIVIPVYNEEEALDRSIVALRDYLSHKLDRDWHIVIADNASTDKTWKTAQSLAHKFDDVRAIHLDLKGRGRALRKAWLESDADIVSYMDVDLSTGLEAFPRLIAAIDNGSDIAIGSRLMRGSQVERCFKRELTSRGYNLLIKSMFFTGFSDAQCGFKAISSKAVRQMVPLIQNNEWFFDTELLILAAKNGYRIAEVPVRWIDDPGTTVNIRKTVIEDLKGLMRLRFHRMPKPK
ncbi:MAG: dolichyl-phosphate beta-glucosyltransferase [Chloroflexota bacterium]|nr:dolichyl-phosphate beta-glucosyltransferase [Chloroflexota bacterium]